MSVSRLRRVYWDLGMLVILMLNVILLPVAIAFFHDAVHPGWLTFNCISDFIFLVDIVLNFWTGVITDENTVGPGDQHPNLLLLFFTERAPFLHSSPLDRVSIAAVHLVDPISIGRFPKCKG